VLQPRDLVVQVRRPFLGKLFFLNLCNVAYPKGRMDHKVTNFELHMILL
jgi:hypothetical protein